MYRKIVVPLDGSDEAERVLTIAGQVLTTGGEVILLQVVPPVGRQSIGASGRAMVHPAQLDEAEQAKSLDYLNAVRREMGDTAGRWRCEITVAGSIVDGIVRFAEGEDADLIAMYTHDRNGLAKLIRGSIAEKVLRRVPIEVKVFKPWELEEYFTTEVEAGEGEGTTWASSMLSEVGPFRGLSERQLNVVATLSNLCRAAAGDVLGHAGDQGDSLYVVVHGSAQISTPSDLGEVTVRIAGPKESFPVSALFGSGTLIASYKALTDMALLAIPQVALTNLCEEDPDLGSKMYRNICEIVAERYASTLKQLAVTEALQRNATPSSA